MIRKEEGRKEDSRVGVSVHGTRLVIRKEEGRKEDSRVGVSVHGTRLVAHAVNLLPLWLIMYSHSTYQRTAEWVCQCMVQDLLHMQSIFYLFGL